MPKSGILKGFVDRGDPAAYDFTEATMTTDGTWRDMDLSAIVPSGAKAVTLRISAQDGAVSNYVRFREKGNTNAYNVSMVRTQAIDVYANADVVIKLGPARVIEYYGSNTTFTNIGVLVKGWWV